MYKHKIYDFTHHKHKFLTCPDSKCHDEGHKWIASFVFSVEINRQTRTIQQKTCLQCGANETRPLTLSEMKQREKERLEYIKQREHEYTTSVGQAAHV